MESIRTINNEDFQLLYQILKKPHLQVLIFFIFPFEDNIPVSIA